MRRDANRRQMTNLIRELPLALALDLHCQIDHTLHPTLDSAVGAEARAVLVRERAEEHWEREGADDVGRRDGIRGQLD